MDSPKSYLFNFSHLAVIGSNPVPQNKGQQVVATTLDEALAKFRVEFPHAEVTQVHRSNTVTV